jgi:uncharacterized membrane protein
MAKSIALELSNLIIISCWSFGYDILVPMATLLLMASSILVIIGTNSVGVLADEPLESPLAAAFKVET